MDAAGPNAEQITYWNEQSGPKWVSEQTRLDRMIAPYGEAAMQALAPRAGERVLDVGCGCGDTTLAIAARVGATGQAVGIDISSPMLARARERATGLASVRFVEADAQTHAFEPGAFDAIYSRFGVMFFVDPVAAFANMRAALAPQGRVAFICWQPITENPWVLVPLMGLASVVTLPPPPAPGTPGPFAFGERARVEQILGSAGLRNIAIEPFLHDAVIGGSGTLDEAVQFAIQVGPAGQIIRQAGPEIVPKATAAVRDALAPYVTPRGVVLPSATWVVTAAR
jgi:SAM-dependent methyltransferase